MPQAAVSRLERQHRLSQVLGLQLWVARGQCIPLQSSKTAAQSSKPAVQSASKTAPGSAADAAPQSPQASQSPLKVDFQALKSHTLQSGSLKPQAPKSKNSTPSTPNTSTPNTSTQHPTAASATQPAPPTKSEPAIAFNLLMAAVLPDTLMIAELSQNTGLAESQLFQKMVSACRKECPSPLADTSIHTFNWPIPHCPPGQSHAQQSLNGLLKAHHRKGIRRLLMLTKQAHSLMPIKPEQPQAPSSALALYEAVSVADLGTLYRLPAPNALMADPATKKSLWLWLKSFLHQP